MNYYPISEDAARRALSAYSFSDYTPGSATASYKAQVDEAAALVEAKKASVSPYYHDKLDALLDRYARRLAENINATNANTARVPSVMIAGPANFPVRAKRKQNARDDTLRREYQEIQGILDQIRSIGTGPVDLADPHAREILTDQLQRAQALLDEAKAANAFYRKNKTLDGCPGITPKDLEWLTRPGVYNKGDGTPLTLHGCPFPPYELTSRREKVKRIKARLEELDRLEAAKAAPTESLKFDGGEIVRNADLNRLQILFDDIPDEATRKALKGEGFKWSPKNQAWQRQLTPNAERAARRALNITGDFAPATDEPQEPEDDFSDIDPSELRARLAESGIVNGEVVDPEKLAASPIVQEATRAAEEAEAAFHSSELPATENGQLLLA